MITLDLAPGSQLHTKICRAVKARHDFSEMKMRNLHAKWRKAEEQTIAYIPESEQNTKRDRKGRPDYKTICLPYTTAMLFTQHTYTTTVFLSRDPVWQFDTLNGQFQSSVQAVEAILGYQLTRGEQLVPLYIWLLDVAKYGLGVISPYWCKEIVRTAAIVEKQEFMGGPVKKVREQKEMLGYEGNRLVNIRPYDFFPDARLPLIRFQSGEFAGCYTTYTSTQLLAMEEQGYMMNIRELLKSSQNRDRGDSRDSSPVLNRPSQENLTGITEGINSTHTPGVYNYIVEINPREWGVGSTNSIEKWIFSLNDDLSLCIGARPWEAYHNRYPMEILEYEPEGYGLAVRGLPAIMEPFQQTMDWLINSHFYNVRQSLNNLALVDPEAVDINSVIDPIGGKVLLRSPGARGLPADQIYTQLAAQDFTRSHVSDVNMLHEFAQRVVGVNDQVMGMLDSTGRKTATEIRTSSTFGVNRLKTQCDFFSALGFAPLGQQMLQNTQQFMSMEKQVRIAGSLAQFDGPAFMTVSPEDILGQYTFTSIDGTMPIDRMAQFNMWVQLFQQLGNNPQLAAGFDIGKMLLYMAQLGGLKNVSQFKVQIQPDEQLAQQAAAGNVIPLGANRNGATTPQDTGNAAGVRV